MMGDTATGTAAGRGRHVFARHLDSVALCMTLLPALPVYTLLTEIYTGHLQSCLDHMLVPLALCF